MLTISKHKRWSINYYIDTAQAAEHAAKDRAVARLKFFACCQRPNNSISTVPISKQESAPENTTTFRTHPETLGRTRRRLTRGEGILPWGWPAFGAFKRSGGADQRPIHGNLNR